MGSSGIGGDVLIFYCIFLSLLWILTWIWRKEKGSRLPGPGHRIFGRITNILALRDMKTFFHVMESWCEKYGPVFTVNFGPYQVTFLNSAEHVQKLLGSTDMAYNGKGFMYEPFKPFWFDGLGISKGDKWKFRRKVMDKHVFSFGAIRKYVQDFSEEGDSLVLALEKEFPNENEEKSIDDVLKTATFNIITKMILGKKFPIFEQVDEKSGMRYTEALDKIKDVVATRALSPWLLLNPLWKLHPMSKVEDFVIKMSYNYVIKNIIDEDDNTKKDIGIKQALLAAGVTLDGVVEEALGLITAGYETTASSLQFLLFFLALNPHHQETCRKEVDSIFDDENLCPNGNIKFDALNKLKHLEMCLFETLRLLPLVFLMMRKIEAPLKLEKDLEIPSGSEVAIFLPGLHKNPHYFPNPDKFIPERFEEENKNIRHPYAFIPFSESSRKCIGYKFATFELLSLSAKLLRHYVISTKDKFEHVEFLPLTTLTPDKPIKFNFKRRPQKNVG